MSPQVCVSLLDVDAAFVSTCVTADDPFAVTNKAKGVLKLCPTTHAFL